MTQPSLAQGARFSARIFYKMSHSRPKGKLSELFIPPACQITNAKQLLLLCLNEILKYFSKSVNYVFNMILTTNTGFSLYSINHLAFHKKHKP
jgi:hypothetical protein